MSATSDNQAKAPQCAALVNALRSEFGEVKVLSVREGDVLLGEAFDDLLAEKMQP